MRKITHSKVTKEDLRRISKLLPKRQEQLACGIAPTQNYDFIKSSYRPGMRKAKISKEKKSSITETDLQLLISSLEKQASFLNVTAFRIKLSASTIRAAIVTLLELASKQSVSPIDKYLGNQEK